MRRTNILCAILALSLCACSPLDPAIDESCTREQHYSVRGHSLDPIVPHMAEIRVLEGYARCNELARGDIVLFSTSERENPVLKIVVGLPGDTFALDDYSLLRNGEILRMLNGTPYRIHARSTRALEDYLAQHPTIAHDAYFVLGNAEIGGMDSSQLGAIPRGAIVGVAVTEDGRRFSDVLFNGSVSSDPS